MKAEGWGNRFKSKTQAACLHRWPTPEYVLGVSQRELRQDFVDNFAEVLFEAFVAGDVHFVAVEAQLM